MNAYLTNDRKHCVWPKEFDEKIYQGHENSRQDYLKQEKSSVKAFVNDGRKELQPSVKS